MISDFLVQHPSGPFFELNEREWQQAVKKYKSLNTNVHLNYVERSATASINIGSDAYFDNETILGQFERLFQLLEFKEDYKQHQIDSIVDNARTHTAKAYSLQDFGKSIGTRCAVQCIEYIDEDGNPQLIDCFFKREKTKANPRA